MSTKTIIRHHIQDQVRTAIDQILQIDLVHKWFMDRWDAYVGTCEHGQYCPIARYIKDQAPLPMLSHEGGVPRLDYVIVEGQTSTLQYYINYDENPIHYHLIYEVEVTVAMPKWVWHFIRVIDRQPGYAGTRKPPNDNINGSIAATVTGVFLERGLGG